MDELNTKNLNIVSNIIDKVWGYRENDLAFLKQRLFNPFIPKEFSSYKFDENFRAAFHINIDDFSSILQPNDTGWELFKQYFFYLTNFNKITYIEYIKNVKLVNKNTIKLKKFIERTYLLELPLFFNDLSNNNNLQEILNICFSNSAEKNNFYNKIKENKDFAIETINNYIIKAFEKIGVYKPKAESLKLVISFNYADWFLCSTGEQWSSCLKIDGGGYWEGLPTTFVDDNRAFLYITNGKRKNWQGIEVENLLARAWCFVAEDGSKIISKFYPVETLNSSSIKSITGDNSYVSHRELNHNLNNKYTVKPLRFKKDGIYFTPYNDIIALDSSYFRKNGEIKYFIGNKGGRQAFNFATKSTDIRNFEGGYHSVLHYLNKKQTINSCFSSYTCSLCNNRNDRIQEIEDFSICPNCLSDFLTKNKYEKCNCCGKLYKAETKKFYKVDGIKVCESCYEERIFTCSICGEKHLSSFINEKTGETIKNYNSIEAFVKNQKTKQQFIACNSCLKNSFIQCFDCGAYIKIDSEKYIYFRDKFYCKKCAKEQKIDINNYDECSSCNKLIPKSSNEKIYRNDGTLICKNCYDNIAMSFIRTFNFEES